MTDRPSSPIDGYTPGRIAMRFAVGAFFGLFIDFSLLATGYYGPDFELMASKWFWLLMAAAPVLCGLVGVFFLRKLLAFVRDWFEGPSGMP